ncbi:MAG: porin family protein [Pseudomonadota bacterium]|nr:porin family protein [Pseudomonadota bacterium]
MNKTVWHIAVTSALMLATPYALATDNTDAVDDRARFYVGLNIGTGSGESEVESGPYSYTSDMDTSVSGLNLGIILRSNARLEVGFNSVTADFEDTAADDEFSGIDFNLKIPFGGHKVKPVIGIGLGAYVWEDTADLFTDDEDLSGIAFNLMGGIIADLHKHFEIEAGYELKVISWQEVRFADTGTKVETNSSMGNFFLGARLKF